MKKRFEKKIAVFILAGLIWIGECILIVNLFQSKITKYDKTTMMLLEKQEGIIIVEKDEKKKWYNNTFFYWKNQIIYYDILEEVKLEDKKHVQIRLKLQGKQNKKKEAIEVSIKEKNISMIDCIINSWDGDKNN